MGRGKETPAEGVLYGDFKRRRPTGDDALLIEVSALIAKLKERDPGLAVDAWAECFYERLRQRDLERLERQWGPDFEIEFHDNGYPEMLSFFFDVRRVNEDEVMASPQFEYELDDLLALGWHEEEPAKFAAACRKILDVIEKGL